MKLEVVMLERDIEKALIKRIELLGGTCEKFTSPAKRSVPDRLVTLPGNCVEFVECKRPGQVPTEKQHRDHARRRALGCTVWVIDSLEGIDLVYPI
jgi:hypothetical protein